MQKSYLLRLTKGKTVKDSTYTRIYAGPVVKKCFLTSFIFLQLEGTNWLVSELATVAAQERALFDEFEALMASASSLQVIVTFNAVSFI